MELLSRATLVTARKIAWFSGVTQNPPRGAMYSKPNGQDNYHRIHNSGITREADDPPYKMKSKDVFLRYFSASAANKGSRIIFEPESSISFWQITAVKTILDQLSPVFFPSEHFNSINLERAARYLGPLSAANGEIGFDSGYFRVLNHKEFIAGFIHELSHLAENYLRKSIHSIPNYSLETGLGQTVNELIIETLGEAPTFLGERMHYFFLANFTTLYLLRGEQLRALTVDPEVGRWYQALKENIFGGREYLNAV
jgi:hypothetical protein